MFSSDLISSEIQRFSDSLPNEAIPLTFDFRRSDVCIQAISVCYFPILFFFLKCYGPVMV